MPSAIGLVYTQIPSIKLNLSFAQLYVVQLQICISTLNQTKSLLGLDDEDAPGVVFEEDEVPAIVAKAGHPFARTNS